MTIEKNKLVSLNYTLKNVQGEIVDSSEGAEPLDYIHGYGFLITGLEKELEGKKIGDKFSVEIEPAEAYGEKNPELIFDVPRTIPSPWYRTLLERSEAWNRSGSLRSLSSRSGLSDIFIYFILII